VCSKADTSQLNRPHATKLKKTGKEKKLKSRKIRMWLRSIGKQSGESVHGVSAEVSRLSQVGHKSARTQLNSTDAGV